MVTPNTNDDIGFRLNVGAARRILRLVEQSASLSPAGERLLTVALGDTLAAIAQIDELGRVTGGAQ